MTVVGYALDVRMELEAVHRKLAMALDEANGQGTLAQHALDADGDLRFVGALDEDTPAGCLDDGGVVEANALAAGDCARYAARGLDAMTAQAAVRKGKHVAANISRIERGRAPIAYGYQELGYVVSLGRFDSVGWLLVREPVGVVGAIITWNGPLGGIAHKAGPARHRLSSQCGS